MPYLELIEAPMIRRRINDAQKLKLRRNLISYKVFEVSLRALGLACRDESGGER
jgi:hypothetical protein